MISVKAILMSLQANGSLEFANLDKGEYLVHLLMLECFYILEQLISVLIEGVKLLGVLLLVVGVDEDSSQVPLQAELLS